jgi:hypothetical protein
MEACIVVKQSTLLKMAKRADKKAEKESREKSKEGRDKGRQVGRANNRIIISSQYMCRSDPGF